MKQLRGRTFRAGRLSGQVVTEIEMMIGEEYRARGGRLPNEDELAERFGVSRIVIREAMKVLEDRGMVEICAGRGTFTSMPSPEKIKESLLRLFRDQPAPNTADLERMLELRAVLEETIAGLAAVRATPEDLTEMQNALLEMERGQPEPAVVEADLRFHRAVARAAHNQYFEIVIEPLTKVLIQQIKLTNSYNVGTDLHRSMYEAIRKGSSVAARQAVRRLMKHTLEDTRRAGGILEDSAAFQPK